MKQGVLTARNADSGKALWTFGSKLTSSTIITTGKDAYVFDTKGTIYRINTKTGAGVPFYRMTDAVTKQQKAISGISLSTQDKALYAAGNGTLVSIRLADGKVNWRNDQLELPTAPERVGSVLLFHSYESGAITVGTTYAIDPSTGSINWRLAGSHSALLHRDGDDLYFQDQWPNPDGGGSVKLDVASLATGEIVRTVSFPALQHYNKFAIDGDDLYIGTNGAGVYRYNLKADPLYAKPALLSDNGSWLAGPYNGKLVFMDRSRMGLHARQMFAGAPVSYEGVNNPVSRLDMIDCRWEEKKCMDTLGGMQTRPR